MSDKDTILDRLVAGIICRDSATATTVAVAGAATDTSIEVASDAGFADGDPIRIGDEFNWIDGTPSSDILPLGRALLKAHPTTDAVVKCVAHNLGPVLADGVTWSLQGSSVKIPVATDRLPIATLKGPTSARIGWPLPSFTPALFAFATGMSLTRVQGSGTSAAPTYITTAGGEFGEEANQTYIAQALTVDGNPIAVEAWNASTRVEGLNVNLSRGQATPLPISASTASFLFEKAAYGFTETNTHSANGGTVWDVLTEAFLFIKSGTATTLNGAEAAGSTAITLTDGSAFANDDWVLVEGAGGYEVTQLKNKSTNDFDIKIAAYRAWGTGVAVTKLTKVSFADIAQAGVALALNVASQDVTSALSATVVHTRLGQADLSLSFSAINVTLANIAYALGVPQADIVSALRLLADGDNIGTAVVPAAGLTGTTKNGATTMVIASGVNLDLASIASTWTNVGDGAALPMKWDPTSCLTILQYS